MEGAEAPSCELARSSRDQSSASRITTIADCARILQEDFRRHNLLAGSRSPCLPVLPAPPPVRASLRHSALNLVNSLRTASSPSSCESAPILRNSAAARNAIVTERHSSPDIHAESPFPPSSDGRTERPIPSANRIATSDRTRDRFGGHSGREGINKSSHSLRS